MMKRISIIISVLLFVIIGCEKEEDRTEILIPSEFILEQVTYEIDMDNVGYFKVLNDNGVWETYGDTFKPQEVEMDWESPNLSPKVKFTVQIETTYVEIRILGNNGAKVLAEVRDDFEPGNYELFVE